MKRTKKSFSTRLSLNILLIVSILFITALVAASIFSHRLISREAMKSADNLLHATISDIEKVTISIETMTRDAAGICYARPNDDNLIRQIETSVLRGSPYIKCSTMSFRPGYLPGKKKHAPMSWIDSDSGEIKYKNLGNEDYDYLHADWYQIPYLTGKPVWTEPYYAIESTGELVTTYSYPLKDSTGEVFAVMASDIDISWIIDTVRKIKPYEHSYLVLVSKCGQLVTRADTESGNVETLYSYALESGDPDVLDLCNDMLKGNKGTRIFGRHTKNMSFAVYGPLSNGWTAGIVCSYREVLASNAKMQLMILLIGLLGLLVLFGTCYAIIRKLTKPLSQFSRSAISIAQGNFDTKLPDIKSDDEIKQLRDSFEYMETSLTKYIENLKITTAANERFESELNIARSIQMHMVPDDFPEDNGRVDLHALLQPAKEVGGDLYDFLIKNDTLYFAIGDVSGKGVPASLVMAITRSALRFTSGEGVPLDKVMSRVNNFVSEGNDTGMFVTTFIGKFDFNTRKLQYCNAGHNPIIVNGEYLQVKPNIAVGLFPDFVYEMAECILPENSRIVLYTDGVTEAENADKEQFGGERLLDWAKTIPEGMNAKEANADLMARLHAFTDGNEQNDDITIMTIKL